MDEVNWVMNESENYVEKAIRLENAKTDIRRLSERIKEDINSIEGLCLREYISSLELSKKKDEVNKLFDSYRSKAIKLIEEEKEQLLEDSRNKDKEYVLITF